MKNSDAYKITNNSSKEQVKKELDQLYAEYELKLKLSKMVADKIDSYTNRISRRIIDTVLRDEKKKIKKNKSLFYW